MFNRDSFFMGALIGLILPVFAYGLLLLLLSVFTTQVSQWVYQPRPGMPVLVSIALNLFPFRYFMVNRRFDRSGRGLLMLTFILLMGYFALLH